MDPLNQKHSARQLLLLTGAIAIAVFLAGNFTKPSSQCKSSFAAEGGATPPTTPDGRGSGRLIGV